MIESALTLPPGAGVDDATLLPTLVLLSRAGIDTSPYTQQAVKFFGEDAQTVLEAFTLVRSGAAPAAVERVLYGLRFEFRADVYVAAAITEGQACPLEWREAARELLFATERPYLR
jgi:hypothetical protein